VRFDDQRRQQGGILEDDNWLNPGLRQEPEYSPQVNNYSFYFARGTVICH
jgi:hypothetical protein